MVRHASLWSPSDPDQLRHGSLPVQKRTQDRQTCRVAELAEQQREHQHDIVVTVDGTHGQSCRLASPV